MQRRVALNVLMIDVGMSTQQHLRHLLVDVLCGDDQQSIATVVFFIGGEALFVGRLVGKCMTETRKVLKFLCLTVLHARTYIHTYLHTYVHTYLVQGLLQAFQAVVPTLTKHHFHFQNHIQARLNRGRSTTVDTGFG